VVSSTASTSSPSVPSIPPILESLPESLNTRPQRNRHLPRRYRDQLPDGCGELPHENELTTPPASHRIRRVTLHVVEKIRTAINRFGLRRTYRGRPTRVPDAHIDPRRCCIPTQTPAPRAEKSVAEIIYPHPNMSSFLFNHHHWCGGETKSTGTRSQLQQLLLPGSNFVPADIEGVNFEAIDEKMYASASAPWAAEGLGWHEDTVTIGVPTGQKPTQASRRAQAAARQRMNQHEPDPNDDGEGPELPVEGVPFPIPGLWHRSITGIIEAVFRDDPASKSFHLHPFLHEFCPEDGRPPERVYGELFTSQAVIDEDARLQRSPPEGDCKLPRVIAELMFWSDSTHLAQFGHAKTWPIYMIFGNQSKFMSTQPAAHAAHHVAFIPSVRYHKL
jgi:hypothetical protein